MYAAFDCFTIQGIHAIRVQVEVDTARGLPSFQVTGMGDSAVKESKHRVLSAVKNSKFKVPPSRITVNLAPADLKKEGSYFDLPIALAFLVATKQIEVSLKGRYLIMGELSLDGSVRPVPGALSAAILAESQSDDGLILPMDNLKEARLVPNLSIHGVSHLREAAECLSTAQTSPSNQQAQISTTTKINNYPIDFKDIKSQDNAKRALTIAAAGGHNLLMLGPPGSGKTLMARALPSILPAQTYRETLEVTQIYSVSGLTSRESPLVEQRPFRAPHHSISDAGLVGGGSTPRAGEISLAHNGVLFLDELTEFNHRTLEAIRQPLEDEHVTISRVRSTVTFPSRVMLIAAMNPCPCGFYGSTQKDCQCSPNQIQKYLARISGPLLDRIDIQIEVPALSRQDLTNARPSTPSETIRQQVELARQNQRKRQGLQESSQHSNTEHQSFTPNANLNTQDIKAHCKLGPDTQALLEKALDTMAFSARAYDKILKIARTIADLAQSADIQAPHLLEALQYRSLDRKYWQ